MTPAVPRPGPRAGSRVTDSGWQLRPEEWIALHRSDVDKTAKVVTVRRRYSGAQVKPGSKTGAERVVPLTRRALDALEAMTPRVDTPILFPAPRGGYIDLEKWRYREWSPALGKRGPSILNRLCAYVDDGPVRKPTRSSAALKIATPRPRRPARS